MTEVPAPLMSARDLVVSFARSGGLGDLLAGKRTSFNAVDGIDLDVRRGEVLGLVGESGSGKTTLGKTLLRLERPTSGHITFRDADITHAPEGRLKPLRRYLQMVFQDPLSSFNPRHSIRRALLTPLLNHTKASSREAEGMVDDMLARVGLASRFKHRFPHEMSGGQLQRAAIGRALVVSPSLIVADEPVSKLDVSVRAKILNLFKDIQGATGVAIVFITHDLRVSRYLCHRIGVMYFGKLMEIGTAQELLEAPRHPYTRALLGTLADGPKQTGPQVELGSPNLDFAGCRYFDRCPIRVDHCRTKHPPLEHVAGQHSIACYEWPRIEERG